MKTFATPSCRFCKASSVVELTSAEAQALAEGELVQNALPSRDADFRELIISGSHPECWDKAFGSDEE